MSILWKTITRSKLDLLHPDLTKEVVLVHAVDARKLLNPPLPDTMTGNAVALPHTEPIKISELLAEDNRPEIAQRIAGLDDRRCKNINTNSFLGMDLAGTSWQGMNVYQKHEFGFGAAKAIRFPGPRFEGHVLFYPSRVDVRDNVIDEGVEPRGK
ncbi:hypothetical protein G6011_01833 [Alternaria panax]|uniref:Uncharacterized protein n=1 Tax=Alternaria panax TaxID=48097 RepID=A0AAD4ILB4_9PLEO|nr:hypothetical protein G6011_01833 [Alternaria panax]